MLGTLALFALSAPALASAPPGTYTLVELDRAPALITEAAPPAWLSSASIAFSPSGDTLLVADTLADTLLRLDTRERRVVDTGAPITCPRPEQILVDPEGVAWVSCRAGRQLLRVESPDAPAVQAIPVGAEPVGLALSPDASTLFVAQRTQGTVLALDRRTGEPVWEAPVPSNPEVLLAAPTGDALYVGHVTHDALTLLDPVTGQTLESVGLALPQPELVASLASRVEALGLLGSAGEGTGMLEGFGGSADPSVIGAVGDDGPQEHAVGLVALKADLETVADTLEVAPIVAERAGEPARARAASAARALTLTPRGRLIAAHQIASTGGDIAAPSGSYGGGDGLDSPVLAALTVIDTESRATIPVRDGLLRPIGVGVSTTIRAAAHHPLFELAFFACEGTSGVLVAVPGPDGALEIGMQLSVGAMPRGIAVHPVNHDVWVHTDGDRSLAVVDIVSLVEPPASAAVDGILLGPPEVAYVPLPASPLPALAERGRVLFHTARDEISQTGLTCASCHPNGREDKRVWHLHLGPRQTPQLASRVAEGPYNWLGSHADLEENLRDTIVRLQGQGLPDDDLEALATYITEYIDPVDNPHAGERTPEVALGQHLFESEATGCSDCHTGGGVDGGQHEVGTFSATEERLTRDAIRANPVFLAGSHLGVRASPGLILVENLFATVSLAASDGPRTFRPGYDTPSLRGVFGTAPYLHDGSAPTLEALLHANAAHDRMGRTSHLSAEEISALAAYLRTL